MQLPLIDQTDAEGNPTKKLTRKLKAGALAGIASAVTIIPLIFPQISEIVAILTPEFAAAYGQTIAAVISSLLSVAGGVSVAWSTRNRATPADLERARQILAAKTAAEAVIDAFKKE